MLWDIIRDWFAQYVFGGMATNGVVYGGAIGADANGELMFGDEFLFKIGDYQLSIGDWLSTTATIVVLVALALFLFLVVRYLFRLTSGLIRGR